MLGCIKIRTKCKGKYEGQGTKDEVQSTKDKGRNTKYKRRSWKSEIFLDNHILGSKNVMNCTFWGPKVWKWAKIWRTKYEG